MYHRQNTRINWKEIANMANKRKVKGSFGTVEYRDNNVYVVPIQFDEPVLITSSTVFGISDFTGDDILGYGLNFDYNVFGKVSTDDKYYEVKMVIPQGKRGSFKLELKHPIIDPKTAEHNIIGIVEPIVIEYDTRDLVWIRTVEKHLLDMSKYRCLSLKTDEKYSFVKTDDDTTIYSGTQLECEQVLDKLAKRLTPQWIKVKDLLVNLSQYRCIYLIPGNDVAEVKTEDGDSLFSGSQLECEEFMKDLDDRLNSIDAHELSNP